MIRILAALAFGLSAFGGAASLGWREFEHVRSTERMRLERLIADRIDVLARTLDAQAMLAAGFAAAFSPPDLFDPEALAAVGARFLALGPDVTAIAWLPRVPPGRADEALAALRRSGAPIAAFQGPAGARGANDGRDLFPVVAVAPDNPANRRILGIDAAAFPDRALALDAVRRSGRIAATPPVRFVQDDVAGVVLYGPVHAGTELVGVVTVGIRTDRLFASLADGALGFTVTDLGAGETMWTSAPREGPSISADLAFADRIYRVEGWAAYAPAGAWRAAITVGGGAALLVALALALGVVMIRGAERLKAEADARAEAESRLAVIVRELNHRVRNVLAVAGALTTQTLRKAGDVDGARTALVDRLHAMGNALKVLDLAHGEGPDIHVLFAPDMLPGAQAIEARGPALKLNAYATQALALVLYELATNAVKHGGEEDRTRAAWRVDDDRFVLVWDETRAQPTAEAPAATGSGFGRDLVERIGPRMIDARATWKATERGVRYELDAPLARVGRLEAA